MPGELSVKVRVDVADPEIEAGERLAVSPLLGVTVAERLTVPAKPKRFVSEIVDDPVFVLRIILEAGFAFRKKSCTFTVTAAV